MPSRTVVEGCVDSCPPFFREIHKHFLREKYAERAPARRQDRERSPRLTTCKAADKFRDPPPEVLEPDNTPSKRACIGREKNSRKTYRRIKRRLDIRPAELETTTRDIDRVKVRFRASACSGGWRWRAKKSARK